MILKRIKIVLIIVILTSILCTTLLFIGNYNRASNKDKNIDNKSLEIQKVKIKN